MKISINGVKFLTELEGSRSDVYNDTNGHATIGVGHLLTDQEYRTMQIVLPDVTLPFGDGLTQEGIQLVLMNDLIERDKSLTKLLTNRLPRRLLQHQYDAIACLVFNIGLRAFTESTLLRRLGLPKNESLITEAWMRWVGRNIPGLVNRRKKEINLYLTGNY